MDNSKHTSPYGHNRLHPYIFTEGQVFIQSEAADGQSLRKENEQCERIDALSVRVAPVTNPPGAVNKGANRSIPLPSRRDGLAL